jgi:hypothetical protein
VAPPQTRHHSNAAIPVPSPDGFLTRLAHPAKATAEPFKEVGMRMRMVVLLVGLVATACGETTAPDTLTGTYALRTIDGSGPPWWSGDAFGFEEVDGRTAYVETTSEFVRGALRFLANTTCELVFGYRTTRTVYDALTFSPLDTTVTDHDLTDSCTFHTQGTHVRVADGDSTYQGSIEGSWIVLLIDGASWRYEQGG